MFTNFGMMNSIAPNPVQDSTGQMVMGKAPESNLGNLMSALSQVSSSAQPVSSPSLLSSLSNGQSTVQQSMTAPSLLSMASSYLPSQQQTGALAAPQPSSQDQAIQFWNSQQQNAQNGQNVLGGFNTMSNPSNSFQMNSMGNNGMLPPQQMAAPGSVLYLQQQLEQQCQLLRSAQHDQNIRNNVLNTINALNTLVRNLFQGLSNPQQTTIYQQHRMQVLGGLNLDGQQRRYSELEAQYFSPVKQQFEHQMNLFLQMYILAESISQNRAPQNPTGFGLPGGMGIGGFNQGGQMLQGGGGYSNSSSYQSRYVGSNSSSSIGGNAIGSYSRGNFHSDDRFGRNRY
jgi:hypothetical protein